MSSAESSVQKDALESTSSLWLNANSMEIPKDSCLVDSGPLLPTTVPADGELPKLGENLMQPCHAQDASGEVVKLVLQHTAELENLRSLVAVNCDQLMSTETLYMYTPRTEWPARKAAAPARFHQRNVGRHPASRW